MTESPGLVSVIVPVYNSQDTLEPLVDRLIKVFRERTDECEILLVNDGSHDLSWNVIQTLASSHREVHGLNLMRNFGQHNALLAGIRQAKGETVVTMDDDLQNPPEEVPKLLDKLADGHAVVYGNPDQEKHGIFRDNASVFVKIALRVGLGYKHASHTSSFRAFRTQLRNAFSQFDAKHVSIDVLLTWATTDFSWVVVQHRERESGSSGYTLRKLLSHTVNMLTSFSTLPLRIASFVGFAFMVFGVVVLLYAFTVYLVGGRGVPGFTFLASIIAIFSGVQLFSLGVIGEYIGRIHQRALNQPCYVIEDQTAALQTQEMRQKND
jgi:undecaprenyl-phosphate 4-deoxy-4-formamido-L-arabinose transferase